MGSRFIPRGKSEYYRQLCEKRALEIDTRFKLTNPTNGHAASCGCYYCDYVRRGGGFQLMGLAPLDANASRLVRRKLRAGKK